MAFSCDALNRCVCKRGACGALEAEDFIQEIFIVRDVGALDLFAAPTTALSFLSLAFFCSFAAW